MALMISAHLDMCQQCHHDCIDIQSELAADLFSLSTPTAPLDSQYLAMMSNITDLPVAKPIVNEALNTSIELDGKYFELPRVLRRHVKNTGNWSRLLGKVWQAPVELGDIGKANFIYMKRVVVYQSIPIEVLR